MELCTINLLESDEIRKIKIKSCSWEEILKSKETLYDLIIDLMLDKLNLFYYATQKDSTKTMEASKLYIEELIEKELINQNVEDIFRTIGWSNGNLDINNTRFQGDFAEYLMNILIDKYFNPSTLISKVSVKTSPRVSSFGNDNIYYDYEQEKLYFGESKFYSDTKEAVKMAIDSLEKHNDIEEISYVRNHSSSYIAENEEERIKIVEKMETSNSDDISINSVFFIMNDDIYKKDEYEELLISKFIVKGNNTEIPENILMIFFPILSKSELLVRFKERVEAYG